MVSCMECSDVVKDFYDHYPLLLSCGSCKYKTCCRRAYRHHMTRCALISMATLAAFPESNHLGNRGERMFRMKSLNHLTTLVVSSTPLGNAPLDSSCSIWARCSRPGVHWSLYWPQSESDSAQILPWSGPEAASKAPQPVIGFVLSPELTFCPCFSSSDIMALGRKTEFGPVKGSKAFYGWSTHSFSFLSSVN